MLLIDDGTLHGQSQGVDDTSLLGDIRIKKNTYSMMIKLIEAFLTKMYQWNPLFNKHVTTYDDDSYDIPTVACIAVKVAQEGGKNLDLKQIITYESICSTFLLQLVTDGGDHSTTIGSYFANVAASNSSTHSTDSEHNFSCLSSSDSTNSNLSYTSD